MPPPRPDRPSTLRADRRLRLVALALALLLIAGAAFALWWGVTHPVGNVS